MCQASKLLMYRFSTKFAIYYALCGKMLNKMQLLFCVFFSLSLFSSEVVEKELTFLQDRLPFIWKFYHGRDFRQMAVRGFRCCDDDGTYSMCSCTHGCDRGLLNITGHGAFFQAELFYPRYRMDVSIFKLMRTSQDLMAAGLITSFAPKGPLGRVTFTPPDASEFGWDLDVSSQARRPDLVWMCEGSVSNIKLTQFLFEGPEKLFFVSTKIPLDDLSKVVVSWGETDADVLDQAQNVSFQTFDFNKAPQLRPKAQEKPS